MSKHFVTEVARRRGLSVKKQANVVLVQSIAFFLKRDKDDVPKKELSQGALKSFQEIFQNHDVIVCCSGDDEIDFARSNLPESFMLFPVEFSTSNKTTLRLENLLRTKGVRFKNSKHREMSFLNIERFALSGLTVVKSNDHEAFGIEREKELTFQELATKRRQNSWP